MIHPGEIISLLDGIIGKSAELALGENERDKEVGEHQAYLSD